MPIPPRRILHAILDRTHPPVARFRILSRGMAGNNRMAGHELEGSKACISCGNCVDTCPVVASGQLPAFIPRTSMALEVVVADQCIRCYRCIAACPQVEPELKAVARMWRRPERIAHWALAVSVLSLGFTGILLFHWRHDFSLSFQMLAGTIHKLFAVIFLLTPGLLWWLDAAHVRRTISRMIQFTPQDSDWLRDARIYVKTWGRSGGIRGGDLNLSQKAWYWCILLILAVLGGTGAVQWIGEGALPPRIVEAARVVHVIFAVLTDTMVLGHVLLKVVWPAWRSTSRGIRRPPGVHPSAPVTVHQLMK